MLAIPLLGLLLILIVGLATRTAIMPTNVPSRSVAATTSTIPGPWLHKLSSLPYLFHMIRGVDDLHADSLHRVYGPVVQIGPRHVSVNSVEAMRDVFAIARRLDRPEPLPFFHNYGAENLVSTVDGDVHQARRRPLRNIYGARAAHSAALSNVIAGAAEGMVALAREGEDAAVDLRYIVRLALYDIMSFVVYGPEHKLNLVRDPEQRKAMQVDIDFQDQRQLSLAAGFAFMLPTATLWLRQRGLAPQSVDGHFHTNLFSDQLTRRALAALQSSESEGGEGEDSVNGYEGLMQRLYAHFRESGGPSDAVPSIEYILSDSLDNFWAGVSTTSDGLVPLFRYLSLPENKARQTRLRGEIRAAVATDGVLSSSHLSADRLRRMPFLEALIKETLRLHPPIPFSMGRRVTEREGVLDVHGYAVPAGWTISSQAMYMQRAEGVFGDDSAIWRPERWLLDDGGNGEAGDGGQREKVRDMKASFFAFGTGPRMCLGHTIAWSVMRGVVAGVYGDSRTVIADSPDEQAADKKSSIDGQKEPVGVVQEWIKNRSRTIHVRFEHVPTS